MNPSDDQNAALPVVPVAGEKEHAGAPDAGAGQPGGETDASGASAAPALTGNHDRPRRGDSSVAVQRFREVVTGQFDADEEDPAVELPRRVLAAQPETPKLHKVLAQAGLGSRLEMEQLILQGRISVNAEPAHIGQRIQFGDTVKVNGKPIRVRVDPPPPRVIAYHKPAGEVVSHDDPQNRPTVFRRLPKLFQGKWQSVGRLDLNTEGLLLLTSSGELANRLMHPRFGLEREYAVRVLGALSTDEKHRLLDGVTLDDGLAQFTSLEAGGGEGANCWYKVTLSEGRNREVRRMFEAVGHAVSRLIRIRYGAMVLPRGLKRGAFVELDERDIAALTEAVRGADPRSGPASSRPVRDRAVNEEGGGRGGRGPRGNPRIRGAQGRRPDIGPVDPRLPGQDQHRVAAGRDDEEREPHDFQPPVGNSNAHLNNSVTGVRRSGNSARGSGAANRGPNSQTSRPRENGRGPGNFRGAPPAQGQQRRDDRGPPRKDPGGEAQPDPMKTSFGYIGADTFTRQREAQGQRRGGNAGGGTNFSGQRRAGSSSNGNGNGNGNGNRGRNSNRGGKR